MLPKRTAEDFYRNSLRGFNAKVLLEHLFKEAGYETYPFGYESLFSRITSGINRYKLKKTPVRSPKRLITRNPKIAVVYNLKRKTHVDSDYEMEAEYDSMGTIENLARAISELGFEVAKIEATRSLAAKLEHERIDVVFNIAEGSIKRAREAQVPAICDLLGIEHTGSDATCLAVALDKSTTSKLMAAEGIQSPRSHLFLKPPKIIKIKLKYPVIVKPNLEGTSKGIYSDSVVDNDSDLQNVIDRLWHRFRSPVLCEEYIQGREFTVGVFGSINLQVVGPMEIAFKDGNYRYPIYSFEAKQADNQMDNEHFKMIYPPDISSILEKRIKYFSKKCFKVVGCRDVARIDLRVTPLEQVFFLEINPLPGLTPGFSDLAILTEKMGWSYHQLIKMILLPAVRRWRRENSNNLSKVL